MGKSEKSTTALTISGEAVVAYDPGLKNIQVPMLGYEGKSYTLHLDEQMAAALSYALLKGVRVAQGGDPNRPEHSFDTMYTAFQSIHGENWPAGTVWFQMATEHMIYRTKFGPELLGTIGTQIVAEIARMPSPPSSWNGGARTSKPVVGKVFTDIVSHHFGQDYPQKSLELLGVFLIRANLLESALVELLMLLSGLALDRAEAIFYSSSNHKARLDIISALLSTSNLDEGHKKNFQELMTKAKKLATQRNVLVHGDWIFKKDGFEVVEKRAVPTSKGQNRIAGHKELSSLCQRYNDLEAQIRMFISSAARSMDKNTS